MDDGSALRRRLRRGAVGLLLPLVAVFAVLLHHTQAAETADAVPAGHPMGAAATAAAQAAPAAGADECDHLSAPGAGHGCGAQHDAVHPSCEPHGQMCSAPDVRGTDLAPPAAHPLPTAAAPAAHPGTAVGHHSASGRSPPDLLTLSVLRI